MSLTTVRLEKVGGGHIPANKVASVLEELVIGLAGGEDFSGHFPTSEGTIAYTIESEAKPEKEGFDLTIAQRKLLDTIEPNDIVDYFGIGNLLDGIPPESMTARLDNEELIAELQNRGFSIGERGRP